MVLKIVYLEKVRILTTANRIGGVVNLGVPFGPENMAAVL
jgi:hypothetical protein